MKIKQKRPICTRRKKPHWWYIITFFFNNLTSEMHGFPVYVAKTGKKWKTKFYIYTICTRILYLSPYLSEANQKNLSRDKPYELKNTLKNFFNASKVSCCVFNVALQKLADTEWSVKFLFKFQESQKIIRVQH